MSYIEAAVIVVLLYIFTPITGETLFKCQGENVTLEFEKIDFHDGTVNWYKILTDGNTELIAYKVGDKDPIVSASFSHNAEIDRDLNLILRNVSSEASGEYFRRIINGGIFNSIVNLYVMCAPSGKPIVTIERKDNGTDSVKYELPPDLGNPKANLAIELLETYFTENGSNSIMHKYEICLIGKSIQCFEGSLCQNYTMQSSFVNKLKILTEHEDANSTFIFLPFAIYSIIISTVFVTLLDDDSWVRKTFFGNLKTVITQRRTIFGSTVVLGVLSIVITIVLWQFLDSEYCSFFLTSVPFLSIPIMLIIVSVKKAKNRKTLAAVFSSYNIFVAVLWELSVIYFMSVMKHVLKIYLHFKISLSLITAVPILIHLGLAVIVIRKLKEVMYLHRGTWPETGNSEEIEALLNNLKTDNAEKQNCEVDKGEIDTELIKMCVDKTDQNDDVRPGSSNSVTERWS